MDMPKPWLPFQQPSQDQPPPLDGLVFVMPSGSHHRQGSSSFRIVGHLKHQRQPRSPRLMTRILRAGPWMAKIDVLSPQAVCSFHQLVRLRISLGDLSYTGTIVS